MSIKPYYVSWHNTTPDEPSPGWYWVDYELDTPVGPYNSVEEARVGYYVSQKTKASSCNDEKEPT